MTYENIATNFVSTFYKTFQEDRSKLGVFYHPTHAFLTFEGNGVQGRDQIAAKYASLPFQQIVMAITKMDAQPTAEGGIMIMVIGQLKADNDPALSFSQIFHIQAVPDGSWVVINDIFRLAVHDF